MPVTIKVDRLGDVKRAIELLASTRVLVGYPSDAEQPHQGRGKIGANERKVKAQEIAQGKSSARPPMTNAVLGYIHENGAPEVNLPARPHLVPGVRDVQGAIAGRLRDAAEQGLAGNLAGVEKNFIAAGLVAQSSVRRKITEGIPPPLAPSTVRNRIRAHPSRRAKTAEDMTALIDTGQLRQAVSFVLRKGVQK